MGEPKEILDAVEILERNFVDNNPEMQDLLEAERADLSIGQHIFDLRSAAGLTQEELANMIGVTRESVNRNLGEFRRLGFVTREGRRLLIRNPEGLRDYWQ